MGLPQTEHPLEVPSSRPDFLEAKGFRHLRMATQGIAPRPHDLFEKRSIKNFIRRLRSEIFVQQFDDIAGFRKHFEIPLAEQGAEDDECDAAMNVVFFAAPLPQVVKLA